jgi:type I restriction enzyme S subunit
MVATEVLQSIDSADLPEEELRWCSVMLNEVLQHGSRLEASVFDVEGKRAREVLKQCKWPLVHVSGDNGLATSFYPNRFKRILVEKSEYPLILPSQIQEIKPEPKGYLSLLCNTDFEVLKAQKGQILLTRSGTIGNCSLVGMTLDGKTISDDIIRITCDNEGNTGYLYAFLHTKIGKALIRANEYGAVVSHIEPEHLESVLIPDPPHVLKKQIHDLVVRSYALRDESNVLLDEAEALLYTALNLPPLEKSHPVYFDDTAGLRNYAVKLSKLNGRLDASCHVPIVDAILRRLKEGAAEIITIGDPRISKRVILPGRFARVYVKEGQGSVFFGGKQLFELDPSNKKYLSLKHHGERIKRELLLKENMVMITCSGTIGKVALVPKHWKDWTANQHIIRIEPTSNDIAGYLYVFLASDYGRELIRRFTYGAVVDEIDNHQVSQIAIPLLKDAAVQGEINRLALEANKKRTEAYYLEQEAIRITNEEVIHVEKTVEAI